MSIGCARGYPGMIRALVDGVMEEFRTLGEEEPAIILTCAALAEFRVELDLTLIGLSEAQRRRQA